ncbi:MAG: glycosyltransferase, partial [Actinobacteria bacterium]|nr:glycosyltransferase [Actinomycetota bacterium]
PDAGRATARSASAPAPGIADAPGWTARAAARRTVRATAYARGAVAVARAWWPTVVHANDHNTMWPALAIRRITGARVLYDSHELWADRNGRPEWRPGLLASEAAFVRAADGLITASPGYSRALAERHRIPTPPAVRNIPVGDAVPSTGPRPGPPEVVYVGGLMRGRGLELTIDALPLAPGVRFRIVGPGPAAYAAALEDRARARGVADRVVLAGAVPPGEVVAAAAGATLGLALIEPICRSYELTLPNKLFEYVRAAVPVLSSPVPVLAGVVREHGLGVVSASLDVADVAAAIRAGVDPAAQERMRSATTAYAATATWDAEAEVLAGVYRSILGRPGSSAS